MAMDPFVAGVGMNVVANLVTNAIQGLGKVIGRGVWERTDEIGRLFYLLESAFVDELPSITHIELERSWRDSEAFMNVYWQLTAGANVDEQHPELVAAIEPLVGGTATETSRQVAERIARPLPNLLHHAKEGDERILLELRRLWNVVETYGDAQTAQLHQLSNSVASMSAAVIIFVGDWPPAIEKAVQRAAAADSVGLAALSRALENQDRAEELPRLIRNPRNWMTALSAEVWELMALSCEEEGLWRVAKSAWLAARERPGADFAADTVHAAEALAQAGDREDAVALLDEARADQPDHPRVAFHDALGNKNDRDALAALEAIETDDDELSAMILLAKAYAYLRLRDTAAARSQLDAAARADAANTLNYRLTDITVRVQETLEELHPGAKRLGQLVQESVELESQLLARNQRRQAAEVRAQASAFYAFLGEFGRAVGFLADGVATYEHDDADARLTLAIAAAHLDADDTIRRLLKPEDSERARARYLSALLKANGDDEAKREAVSQLDALLSDKHQEIRSLAAGRRLALAARTPDVAWSDEAEAIVRQNQVPPAVVFKTWWHEKRGDIDSAERELLAHSNERWAIAELMSLAARAEDWPKAARHARTVLSRDADWRSQLHAAETLSQAGQTRDAEAVYTRLGENPDAPASLKAGAYRRLSELTFNEQAYARSLAACERWAELQPESQDAAWMEVMSLAMLGRDAEALALLKDRELRPRQPLEYRFAGRSHLFGAEAVEALRAIVELADQHNPPSEEMEALVISAALRAGDRVPAELHDRVTIPRFMEMFPQSDRFEAHTFEQLKQYLEEDLADRAASINEVEKQVFNNGDMPTAVLAAVTGNDLGSLWARSTWGRGLPIGYGSVKLDALERADARAALGAAVLWDSTSIFVVDHVLADLSDRIQSVLPGGCITQAALADITEGARAATMNDRADGVRQEVTYNLTVGKPEMVSWDPEVIREFASRANSAKEFAQGLDVVVNADPDDPQDEDAELEAVENHSFLSFIATFGTARRLKLPVFSDDRDIRRLARTTGLPAFGTVGLLDALFDAGHIIAEERTNARRALLRARALGVEHSTEELVRLARDTDWHMTFEFAVVAVLDRGPWRESTADTFLAWLELLRCAFREAPERFPTWVVRFLDSVHRARPEVPLRVHAQHAVTLSLVSTAEDAARFLRALVRALASARQYFSESLGDPTLSGFLALAHNLGQHDYPVSPDYLGALLWRGWLMLPLESQPEALALLAGFGTE